MPKDISLSRQAAIAMALTIGFYTLALVLGLGMIAFPFILANITGKMAAMPIVVCLITGFTILAAMVPRKDKFKVPGPLLTPTANPKLFEVITEIAHKTGQPVPDHVYLISDFNACVMQRGGAGGFGGNRIMALGLPLLKELSISQFKAIIAHEFGHYNQGDTALGPRVYQIHSALERTIGSLRERHSIMQIPFKWYGNKFLKITSAISRSQEFGADRLAAKIVGKDAMLGALEVTAMKGPAFDEYLHQEFFPIVDAGLLPPLLEGYSIYLKSGIAQKKMSEDIQEKLKRRSADEYDSHPSLKERLIAIVALDCEGKKIDAKPAIDLIEDPERLERLLLKSIIKYEYFKTLKPLSWDQDLAPIYISNWKKGANEYAALFREVTPGRLPEIVRDPSEYLKHIDSRESVPEEEIPYILHGLQYALTVGLALFLINDGWDFRLKLGDEARFTKGNAECYPFKIIWDLAEHNMTGVQWIAFCDKNGITDRSLAWEPAEKSKNMVPGVI